VYQRAKLWKETTVFIRATFPHTLGQDNAIFTEEPTALINQGCPSPDEPLQHPMEGLEILLHHLFDRRNTHDGSGQGFADRVGIAGITLRRLDRGFDDLRSNQPHVHTLPCP
jgi:hypothetical protein